MGKQEEPIAKELLEKFLKENKLFINVAKANIRTIDGGGIIIEAPQLVVGHINGRKT